MPKKTKKDKIMAKLRRASSSQNSVLGRSDISVASVSPYVFKNSSYIKQQQAVSEYAIELKTIKADLLKTILLAIIAFSVEFYLYWLLRK